MRSIRPSALALCAALVLPAVGQSQEPVRRAEMDSLRRQLAALQARLDSILRAQGPGARGDSTDPLAALRAAARAAAGPAQDSTPAAGGGRERNLSQLNPEISVTGDFRAYGQTDGPQTNNFQAREVEVSFQSTLDPYSHTKIFAAVEDGAVDVEEAYVYWTGLPGRLRLDVGRFRQQFGELNRWHLHAVPEGEYPLALTTYMGDEGLIGTGAALYGSLSGLGTHEVWAQVTKGDNDVLFTGGGRPAFLAHLNNFWQVSRSSYVQLGATLMLGSNPDDTLGALRTRVGGIDARFTWRPPAAAKYREWTLRGELLALRQEYAGAGDTKLAGYVGTTYKLGARWIAGMRYDYVEDPAGGIIRQLVPSLTIWQSEWVRLHAEWLHRRDPSGNANLLALQAVWSIGPHKHEIY
jgi:hypothetical protein